MVLCTNTRKVRRGCPPYYVYYGRSVKREGNSESDHLRIRIEMSSGFNLMILVLLGKYKREARSCKYIQYHLIEKTVTVTYSSISNTENKHRSTNEDVATKSCTMEGSARHTQITKVSCSVAFAMRTKSWPCSHIRLRRVTLQVPETTDIRTFVDIQNITVRRPINLIRLAQESGGSAPY